MSSAWGADAPVGLDEREDFPAAGAADAGLGTYPGVLSRARRTPPSSVVGSGSRPMLRQATKPSGRTSSAPPDPMP
jgi:hypothetical protein